MWFYTKSKSNVWKEIGSTFYIFIKLSFVAVFKVKQWGCTFIRWAHLHEPMRGFLLTSMRAPFGPVTSYVPFCLVGRTSLKIFFPYQVTLNIWCDFLFLFLFFFPRWQCVWSCSVVSSLWRWMAHDITSCQSWLWSIRGGTSLLNSLQGYAVWCWWGTSLLMVVMLLFSVFSRLS